MLLTNNDSLLRILKKRVHILRGKNTKFLSVAAGVVYSYQSALNDLFYLLEMRTFSLTLKPVVGNRFTIHISQYTEPEIFCVVFY